MKRFRLAALTFFALPLPLVAMMLTVHCHGAGFPDADVEEHASRAGEPTENMEARVSVVAGQSITSLVLSPGVLPGGQKLTGTISLRYPAPAGGLEVAINNDNRRLIEAPARIVIPEGETKAHFRLVSRPVKNLTSVTLLASYQTSSALGPLTLLPAVKKEWVVSPNGTREGEGSKESPWDLRSALNNGPRRDEITPGDTIWLRGGVYRGTYLSMLSGTPDNPIIVRAVPGERVIIDKGEVNDEKQPALKVKGSWVWFWGMEITNSNTNRQRSSPYTGKDQPWRGSGADVYAPHVKFINMIFHDNGHGIWDKQDMTEIHGCIFFYNGNNKREHGLYIGNRTGTKYITDNILFSQGGYGILSHSDSSASSQKGLHLEGNISFNNGIITNDDQKTGNLQVGGVEGEPAARVLIKNNYIYNNATNANSKNTGIRVGYEDRTNKDIEIANNYIVSEVPLLFWWWQSATVHGNTIISTGGDLVDLKMPAGVMSANYRWDFNNYFTAGSGAGSFIQDRKTYGFMQWRRSTQLDQRSRSNNGGPNGVDVFVRPNRYEPGRANIVVYNWDKREHITVDLAGVLEPGAQFEIRDAQNYFAVPVAVGVYNGSSVSVPMKLSNVTRPIGNVERLPRHTSAEFGVFTVTTIPSPASR